MFDIIVTQEQFDYAKRMVEEYNFGQRGYGDGNTNQQLTGIIGQTVFSDLTGEERPDGSTGFDGGRDFFINGKRIDIKTMTRKVPVRDYYVHNFIGYQRNYDVDYYIFASYNISNRTLTICGFIDKKGFFNTSVYYKKGSLRTRADGTSFRTFAPLYEISQTDLHPVNNIEDLLGGIL